MSSAKITVIETGAEDEEKAQESFTELQGIIVSSVGVNDELKQSLRQSGYYVQLGLTRYSTPYDLLF